MDTNENGFDWFTHGVKQRILPVAFFIRVNPFPSVVELPFQGKSQMQIPC
jgi:hypothetical protein